MDGARDAFVDQIGLMAMAIAEPAAVRTWALGSARIQHQGRGQTGRTLRCDDVVMTHAPRLEPSVRITYERCCFWENRVRYR